MSEDPDGKHLRGERRPEPQQRRPRPPAAQPATEQAAVRSLLGNGGQLHAAPAMPEDLQVVVTPAVFDFSGPADLVQATLNEAHEFQPVHGRVAPVITFPGRPRRLLAAKESETGTGGFRERMQRQASLPAGPTAHHGLQEKEQGHQGSGPEAPLGPRDVRLRGAGDAHGQRQRQTGQGHGKQERQRGRKRHQGQRHQHVILERRAHNQPRDRVGRLPGRECGRRQPALVAERMLKHRAEPARGVPVTAPHAAVEGVKALRVFAGEQGIGFTLALLAAQVGAHRRSP